MRHKCKYTRARQRLPHKKTRTAEEVHTYISKRTALIPYFHQKTKTPTMRMMSVYIRRRGYHKLVCRHHCTMECFIIPLGQPRHCANFPARNKRQTPKTGICYLSPCRFHPRPPEITVGISPGPLVHEVVRSGMSLAAHSCMFIVTI